MLMTATLATPSAFPRATNESVVDAVFPPSKHPRLRKLILRNTSMRPLVIKIKPVYAEPAKRDAPENLGTVIAPLTVQHIFLVNLPNDMQDEEFPYGKNISKTKCLTVKERDQVEIHVRPFLLNQDADVEKKHMIKRINTNGREDRILVTKRNADPETWQERLEKDPAIWHKLLVDIVERNEERYDELVEWARSGEDQPTTLVQTLRIVCDARRFVAPEFLVDLPGQAILVESVPFPVDEDMIDTADCRTANHVVHGTKTAAIFHEKQLLHLTPSDSQCGTARYPAKANCDWFSSWLTWLLPPLKLTKKDKE